MDASSYTSVLETVGLQPNFVHPERHRTTVVVGLISRRVFVVSAEESNFHERNTSTVRLTSEESGSVFFPDLVFANYF